VDLNAAVTEAISRVLVILANLVAVTRSISRHTGIFTNLVAVTEAISRVLVILANLVAVTETAKHLLPSLAAAKMLSDHVPRIFQARRLPSHAEAVDANSKDSEASPLKMI